MNAAELRTKSKSELERMLKETRAELHQLRFDVAQGRLKNIRELRSKKQVVAQLLTVLAEPEQER